jgi:hypothetical protein
MRDQLLSPASCSAAAAEQEVLTGFESVRYDLTLLGTLADYAILHIAAIGVGRT